eukprot:5638942-Prymnesium_polylepis.1
MELFWRALRSRVGRCDCARRQPPGPRQPPSPRHPPPSPGSAGPIKTTTNNVATTVVVGRVRVGRALLLDESARAPGGDAQSFPARDH